MSRSKVAPLSRTHYRVSQSLPPYTSSTALPRRIRRARRLRERYGYGPAPAYGPTPAAADDDEVEYIQPGAGPRAASADAVEACARRYRSYDRRSMTFLSNDGTRKACP